MSKPTQPPFPRYQLAELAALGTDTFVDGPFGSSLKSHEYVDSGVRLIQLQNIGEGEWHDENKKFITPRKFKTLERHGAVPGDIAIAKMADPVARACLVPPVSEQFVVVADCIRLRLDESRFDPGFVVRSINSPYTRREAEKKAIGSTRVRINLSVLKTVGCLAPELSEQQAITRVLDTLDTAIRETEALIDKLKAVKQGLLHDLLTRGIDANGQLRPPQSEAPQLYKESPLGWIPREWEVLPLENVADLQVGFAFKSEWFLDTGKTRLLRGDNVGYGSPEWEAVKYLSDEAAHRFANYLLKEGDVVIGMDRTFTKTGSKFSVINQDDLPCLLVQRVGRFMPRLCSIDFLRQLTLWPAFQRNLLAQQKGMDIPHLSKSEILSPLVPVPTTYEQGAISERMASFEQRITFESSLMAKLKSQKSGLMDDLLTGRIRVTPILASVQRTAEPTEA